MTNSVLFLKRDFASGLPSLQVRGLELSESELKQLEGEIIRDYTRLRQINDGVVTLHTPVEAFPQPAKFRVRVRNGSSERCPDIVFEPLFELPQSDRPDATVGARPEWHAPFFGEVDRLFAPEMLEQLGQADQVALEFVLDELRRLASERPQALSPLLVAGFIALSERMAVSHDEDRLGLYTLAARGLDTLFDSLLPERTESARPAPRPFAIKLRSTARILARLLGIGPLDSLP